MTVRGYIFQPMSARDRRILAAVTVFNMGMGLVFGLNAAIVISVVYCAAVVLLVPGRGNTEAIADARAVGILPPARDE